jgi:hypothetical protein
MGGSGKKGIPLSALSASYGNKLIVRVYDLRENLLSVGISNDCAERDKEDERRRIFSMLISFFSGFAVRRWVTFLGEKFFQGGELGVSPEDYISSFSAIAAVRSAPEYAFGLFKTNTAFSAIA